MDPGQPPTAAEAAPAPAPTPAPPSPIPPLAGPGCSDPEFCLAGASEADVAEYTHIIAQFASYPDWWERAVSEVEHTIDPDGLLAFWGGGRWLKEGALVIVGAVMARLAHRQDSHIMGNPEHIPPVDPAAIARLDAAPCFPQRTPGWFMDRHTLITASVAWKAISSEASLAALVREKLKIPAPNMSDPAANPTSPLHWGQKYEPVATELYAEWCGVEVREYGCIRHSEHAFLGASPDGVVVSPGPMYGRMLEIKNVVNRELTGIPKRDYWVQMQMQMEACDLPLCDFLECQFIEYDTWAAATSDGSFNRTADGKRKGALLMLFDEEAQRIRYFYPPLTISTLEEYTAWESREREVRGMTWMQRIWWRLESYSLVTVERNPHWFAAVLERFEDAWAAVLEARARAEAGAEAEPTTDGSGVAGVTAASAAAAASGPGTSRIDPRRVLPRHDVRSDAGAEAQRSSGRCLIRQDFEEDDDSSEEPGP
jgi:hypothetical protein